MKKFILILMAFASLLASMAYAQAPDRRVYPYSRDAEFIIGARQTSLAEPHTNGLLDGSTYGSMQNGTVVSTKGYDGAVTLWFLGDTTGVSEKEAGLSDSCLTVYLALKNKETNLWGGLYSETTTGYTKLDTIDRAYINGAGDICPYMVVATEDAWAVADSAKFMFGLGTGDSLNVKIVMQGF